MWRKSDFEMDNDRTLGYAKDEMQTLLQDWNGCIRKYKYYRVLLSCVLGLGIIAFCVVQYIYLYNSIPSRINIRAGREETIDLGVPVKGELLSVGLSPQSNIPAGAVTIDFSKPVTLKADKMSQYKLDVKLFGLFTMKEVGIQVLDEQQLIPVGGPVGIYLETDGILVVGVGSFTNEGGTECSPAKELLKSGDYIKEVNGQEVTTKREIVDIVEECEGYELSFVLKRGEEYLETRIMPEKDSAGEYKIGVWLRDNAQGIGTLTYVDVDGNFGALGHSINDVDTGTMLTLQQGILYGAEIVGIKKGVIGTPGELTGYISYTDSNMLGTINTNSGAGIYGVMDPESLQHFGNRALPIGYRHEIQKGPAQILTTLEDTTEYYDIEIDYIRMDNDNVNRGIEFTVTDKELLDITGGIVQGMSGSPIIQDGKLIGAVTHVLVNDPTRGYGIFIENMLEHN
ncbi:MAG: SpoIVB peptidase [Lachnospiraceae bacterium]|nr:SpoIVB peptidase [Lachnospiraceae bacterium]